VFEANSRYARCPVVEVETGRGDKVQVVKLRRLPFVAGNLTETKGTDRLDVMARRVFQDGTRFWHVADANTELVANDLVHPKPSENPLIPQQTTFILVPEN
jgi:hypothetical protein